MPHRAHERFHAARLLALLALAVASSGMTCEDPHIGRRCELGTAPIEGATGQTMTLSSPALECPSRICLLPGGQTEARSPAQAAMGLPGTGPLCTAGCESNADCEGGEIADPNNPADARCRGGFLCRWLTPVGDHACQKMCVCVDFLRDSAASAEKPPTCP